MAHHSASVASSPILGDGLNDAMARPLMDLQKLAKPKPLLSRKSGVRVATILTNALQHMARYSLVR